MKTQITLLAFLFLLVNVYANNTNSQNLKDLKNKFSKETILIKANDTVKQKRAYKVIRNDWKSNGTTIITVSKVGEGNKVFFIRNKGRSSFLRKSQFKSTSGLFIKSGNRGSEKGFQGVEFPATVSIQSFINNDNDSFRSKANVPVIFEVKINEPGIWEISFQDGGQDFSKERGKF